MSTNIEEILENMDDLLDHARNVPFTNRIMIDADEFRDLINDARMNIPQEIKRAKVIDSDREKIMSSANARADAIIDEANAKADAIVKTAQTRAQTLTDREEIYQAAKKKAVEVLNNAQNTSKEVRAALDNYVETKLTDLEEELQKSLNVIKDTKSRYKKLKK